MSRIDTVISSILLAAVLVVVALVVIYVPANMRAEARCLKNGYPSYSVTWDLHTYCMTLDGAVTVDVQELQ